MRLGLRFVVPRAPLLFGGALLLSVSCATDFDDARKRTEPVGTLGEDLYTALCDRVGASVLTEDITGRSYHRLCHRDANGEYGDTVDENLLPPVALDAAIVRRLAVAKLHAMGRRRVDLIRALDATFSDDELPNPLTGEPVRGHVALQKFLQRMGPLYDSNPIDKDGSGAKEGLMPSVTRSTGRLFASLAGPGKDAQSQFGDEAKAKLARQALARLSGRLGYRPLRVALGAMRPSMAYPDLRGLTQTFAPKVRPGGNLRDAFQSVLGMAQTELGDSKQAAPPGPWNLDNPTTLQPNRPRTNTEIARAIMLATDPVFAAPGAVPRYLVARDTRGYAVPTGNQPGVPGTVPAPFSDANGDGFADVDALGRFVSGPGGELAQVDTPFVVPGLPRLLQPDEFGRAVSSTGEPVYQYFDTSQTFVAATTRDLDPLLNGDPALQSEAIADLLSGAFALYGGIVDATAPWSTDGGTYKTFDSQNSPMVDLMYATGWMFAHKSSDVHLKMVKQLFTDHEPLMARVIGAALHVEEIANSHPEARLDPSVTLWDELQEIIVEVARDPALFHDVAMALADPNTQAYLGNAFSKYAAYKDELGYDPNNLNGPPINYSDQGNPEPHIPPDYSQPDVGTNRSDFYRILQIIHDVNGVNACNKAGAKVKALGITLPGSYNECELFYFQNMGLFYLKSIIQSSDFSLKVRPELLNLLLQIGGVLGLDANKVFEDGSGIQGMTLKPTSEGLNRLVFFGSTSGKFGPMLGGQMPDVDPNVNGANADTNEFISLLVEPVSTAVCPERLVNVPNPGGGDPNQLWLADCSNNVTWKHSGEPGNPNDLLRLRNRNTIFLWEKFEFYKAMRPILKAFDDHGKGQIFLESIEALYRHWPSANHGPECNPNGNFADRPWKKYLSPSDETTHTVNPAYNAKFCNSSNAMSYEPVLVEAFVSDLIPALGSLVSTLNTFTVVDDRNGAVSRNGMELLREMTLALFDPDYAASVGMTDRLGGHTAPWANGQIVKPQITPFDMFGNALRKFDELIPADSPRRARWRNARSRLVDQFLGVNGAGETATFRNPAFIHSIPILVDVLRAQINANCPDRETSPVNCRWAVGSDPIADPDAITVKMMDTFRGPTFATTMMLLEAINEDPDARRALEKHLRYLVQEVSGNDALTSMLASSADMMQILSDDENMPPIYNAVAVAAAPEGSQSGTGDRVVELMDALTRETNGNGEPVLNPYDPYHVLDSILRNLVSPLDPSNPESLTPLEIFLDTIAEVNRIDSDLPNDTPLDEDDMQAMFGTLRDFMAGQTRGMEQFYEIVRHRDGK